MHDSLFPFRRLPLARTAALSLLAILLLVAAGLVWWSRAPSFKVEDRYVDGELVQGLTWLRQSLRSEPAPHVVVGANNACASRLASGLAELNQRLRGESHVPLDWDCEQVPALDKALHWLLEHEGKRIPGFLQTPVQHLGDWLAQRDPFRLPGCLFLHTPAASASAAPAYCTESEAGWQAATSPDALPPRSEALWASLAYYRQARREHSPNRYLAAVPGSELTTPLAQGPHQWLALEPGTQQTAQTTAACYTGDAAACRQCPWCNTLGQAGFYEGARARMVGVLLVDVRHGGILAAASAHSRCYQAQHSGQPLPPDCPRLPTAPAARPWRLGNHALEQAAMPGSLVKMALAAGLLEAGLPAASRTALVNDWLVRSDTEAFIDTALCRDQDFQPACSKARLRAVQAMATAMGWNAGCTGGPSCGQQDVLGAGGVVGLDYPVLAGRFLAGGDNAPVASSRLRLDANAMRACYRNGQKQRWRDCRGADLVDTLAELYGQGNAQASAAGVADHLLQLASAAAGQTQAPLVHLLQRVDGEQPRQTVAPQRPIALHADTARSLLGAMGQTHIRGTAYAACLKASQTGGVLRCQANDPAGLRIAGKTGTPLFPADKLSLPQWRAQCAQLLVQPQIGRRQREEHRHALVRCGLSPYKWYAALLGKPGSDSWDTAVVVLAERNWNAQSGVIDSAEDHGANVAAEIGLSVANALASPPDTVWQALAEPPVAAPAAAANPRSATPARPRAHSATKKPAA
jgi:hypothetical protein